MKNKFLLVLFLFTASGCHQAHVRSASHFEKEKVEGSVHFEFGRWVLLPEQSVIVSQKAEYLKEHQDVTIILEGYTDLIGAAEYNLELGDRRAREVKLELAHHGIDPGRVVIISYGKDRSLSHNYSAEARQQERRVDFKVK